MSEPAPSKDDRPTSRGRLQFGLAGALLAGVVESVGWAEQKTSIPRSLVACC